MFPKVGLAEWSTYHGCIRMVRKIGASEPTLMQGPLAKEETAKVEPEKTKEKNIGKVEVRLQAAGDAPIMKQKNYNVRFFNALCL